MKSNTSSEPLQRQIAAVRGFSRFYTSKLGIIEPKLLHSRWTLQEARIIYEIAQRDSCTATDLVRALGLDAGFLSRTLRALQRRQIVARKPSQVRPARHRARPDGEGPGGVRRTRQPIA